MKIARILQTILTLMLISSVLYSNPIIVNSPDGLIEVELKISEKLIPYPEGERLYYSVKYKGKTVLLDSPFGLDFKNMPPLAKNFKIIDTISKSINEKHEEVWGKNKLTINSCNETELQLQEVNGMQRKFSFFVRAYNDGVALRYVFGDDAGFKDFKLTSEIMEFHFAANHRIWAADYFGQQTTNYMDHISNTQTLLRPSDWPASYSGFYSHQESEFVEQFLNLLSPNKVYGCPILLEVEKELWVALTEANLTDWAGMYFSHSPTSRNALVTALSPRIDEKDVLVKSTAPRQSPWRIIMIGEHPGEFIESDLITNLNEPCAIEDPSWITPGISAWDRWWSGSYAPDANFEVGMNQETMKYFIDFASEMGWEYQLVDWTWYGAPFYPDTWTSDPSRDITKSIPEVDIPELVKYADSKNVKILLWLEWEHSKNQMHEAFPLYEKWGVAGVKIDFMQRDDQEMVNYYHETVRLAAKHKLTVDFHGAYKPTGWERTYPNLITREGILGNEYNKWSDRITPDHCLTLPFTRAMLGQSDFTPGGFLNRKKEDFKVVGGDEPAPQVMGTRAFQLAMMIIYYSPLHVLCDSPFNYRNFPDGLDFLKSVPTVWDETKFIQGEVGNFITVARRSGDIWYVGSMTDWDERELKISFDFLKEGDYTAEIIKDPEVIEGDPVNVEKETLTVNNSKVITAKLASGGGHIIVIKPKTK